MNYRFIKETLTHHEALLWEFIYYRVVETESDVSFYSFITKKDNNLAIVKEKYRHVIKKFNEETCR